MKKLLIGLLVLTSVSAFASAFGTPDEDPIVANLRLRFEKAIEPKAEYLLQHAFKCKQMISRRGEFRNIDFPSHLRFEEVDGFLSAVQAGGTMDKVLYTFNGKELIGSTRTQNGNVVYEAYRIDLKGYLISEFINTNPNTRAELAPISFSKGRVESYILCIPE